MMEKSMSNDLISRSALLTDYGCKCGGECAICRYETDMGDCRLLFDAPAVDAELVRHGQWICKGSYMDDDFDRVFEYYCSICGRCIQVYDDIAQYPYCHCGAKMDGDKNA